MAMQQLSLPGNLVKISNAMARARWQPESVWEPRIIALVASKVQESDEDFFTYRIPVAELTGHSDENMGGKQYKEIARSIEHLGTATIRLAGKKPRNFRQYNIFAMCGYEDGCLVAEFHPDLKPHFLNLKAHFTAYNLFEYLTLPSSYSQKMFEILKSWAGCPEVIISLEELHDVLNTPESLRVNFKDFRRRVLEQAHKDITTKTSLRFDWEPVKKGRGVGAVRFLFPPLELAAEGERARQEPAGDVANYAVTALECARRKKGACAVQDRGAEVCKTCQALDLCGEIAGKKRGAREKQ